MRRSIRLAGVTTSIVIGLLLIVGFVLIVSYSDIFIVERSYRTKEKASEDGAFERGWLPDYIPHSAANISLRRNRDVCFTDGSFDFAPSDSAAFAEAIRAAHSERYFGQVSLPGAASREATLIRAGYETYRVSRRDGSALFMVHAEHGHCVFATGGRVPEKTDRAKPHHMGGS
jgi:voltage-gated potassium channel Kch